GRYNFFECSPCNAVLYNSIQTPPCIRCRVTRPTRLCCRRCRRISQRACTSAPGLCIGWASRRQSHRVRDLQNQNRSIAASASPTVATSHLRGNHGTTGTASPECRAAHHLLMPGVKFAREGTDPPEGHPFCRWAPFP